MNKLPNGVIVSDVSIKNVTPTSASESFNGIVNVKKRNIQWWEIKFSVTASGQKLVRELESFADSLNGRFGEFELPVGNKGKPLSDIRGVATTTEAAAGKNLVKVNGISGELSSGDFIRFANHNKVYRITSYDSKTSTAQIQPALRKAVKNGEQIKYDNVTFRVSLSKDDITYTYADTENIITIKFDVRERLK